ncbi:aspartic proteinase precursor [Laetiporus sulphureus 93-53]|uniref:Aspartic proteinase n=1 Tax=Laetiporus sulphureus 93-53 TaxID=1314785 RepID=A0A165FAN2_9APHY|nr:aspartic proteinase precursor [Laetiporus sulphureus 93-53]KZT08681.1 aspartic proteinase precursor [Laetiporus sulphureus 93-53]
MALSSTFLSLVFLTLTVAGNLIQVRNGAISIPMVKQMNTTGIVKTVERDQARAKYLKGSGKYQVHSRASSSSVSATSDSLRYVVNVGVGSPATYYSLLIDTGSSNAVVGVNKAYVATSTSVDTGDQVEVQYGSGAFIGEEYNDTVTLGNLVISQQSIAVPSYAEGFTDMDGILGVGPTDLTEDTVTNMNTVPTVTDNLYSQGLISEYLMALSFEPATSDSDSNGELTFGGTDSSKYTGSINYVPLTTTSPSSTFWGIDQSITYGSSNTEILTSTAGVVDSGTTLTLIASDAFSRYQQATGAVQDENTGLLRITADQYDQLESLYFNIGGQIYEFTANAQIWPRSLNSAIGGSSDNIYLVVTDIGSDTGSGMDFINGLTFLERFYSVFDTGNSRVGFASTSYTNATTN